MTRADLKHCGKIPDAREELNRSVREGRIESRHSIKSLEGMGSGSHDLGAELRMHSFTVYCDTFSNEEKVYHPGHSNETALLNLVNDLFLCLNKGNISVLALLDFSSGFHFI